MGSTEVARRHPVGPYTFDDFNILVSDDQKADLIDGIIYLAPPELLDHNDLLCWLACLVGMFAEQSDLGHLTIGRVAYRLSDRDAPEPDLGFVASHRVSCIKHGYVDGPPDLAVEIVSPESADRDYENKRKRYEKAGVHEYWIIDPLDSTATFLVRQGDVFVERLPTDHVFRSDILPGFELDVRWLWQRPLPPTLPIVRRLLGS